MIQIGKESKPVSSDSLGQLQILGHDGHSLGLDRTQICVLKQGDEVSFSSFLKSQDCLTLESNFLFPLLGNLSDKSLERQLSDQKVSLK